jgi:hypothetical protein
MMPAIVAADPGIYPGLKVLLGSVLENSRVAESTGTCDIHLSIGVAGYIIFFCQVVIPGGDILSIFRIKVVFIQVGHKVL